MMTVPRASSEDGQITVMLVVFALCLLLAIAAVIDISGSYLRRQSMTSLADGAALAVSDAASAAVVYSSRDTRFVIIGRRAALAAVDDYLRQVGAYTAYPHLRADVVVQGHVVEVFLTTSYTLPVRMPGVAATTTIHATAASEMPIY